MAASSRRELRYRFAEDAAQHLAAITRLLVAGEDAPPSAEAANELQRRLHSIKGLAAALDLDAAASLAHAMEDAVAAPGWTRSAGTVDALLAGVDALSFVQDCCARGGEISGDTGRAVALACAALAPSRHPADDVRTCAGPPNVGTPGDPAACGLQAEIRAARGVFLEHAEEKCRRLADGLVAIEEGTDTAAVDELFRLAHNLKGAGAMYGLRAISDIAHALEDALDALRTGRRAPDPPLVSALLQAVDALRATIASPDARGNDAGLASLAGGAVRAALAAGAAQASTAATAPAPRRVDPFQGAVRLPLPEVEALMNQVHDAQVASRSSRYTENALEDLLRMTRRARRYVERGLPVDVAWLATAEERLTRALDIHAAGSSRVAGALDDIQERLLDARLTPLGAALGTAPRLVRDLARRQGKQVRLAVDGEATRIDRVVLEQLEDPIVHLLRNAVDHGIEPPAARRAAGKPEAGTVRVLARKEGDLAVVLVEDDGAGIDPLRVRRSAVARGLLSESEAAALDDDATRALVFRPELTTADRVTELSGRGVGLDVVATQIARLGGSVEVRSEVGRGTTFVLRVPVTLAVAAGLFVKLGEHKFCLPLADVERVIHVDALVEIDGTRAIREDGGWLPCASLGRVLALPAARGSAPAGRVADVAPGRGAHAVVLAAGGRRAAVLVDRVLFERRMIVRPFGPLLPAVPCAAGGTLQRSGEVCVVLDAKQIVRAVTGGAALHAGDRPPARRRVLVVDDSSTMREMVRAVLEAAGYEVDTAEDGAAALDLLTRRRPDAMVADVQMPRLDGLALTRRVKGDPVLRDVRVVILSALGSADDRRRGLESGADAYAVKSAFDERSLVRQLDALIGDVRGAA